MTDFEDQYLDVLQNIEFAIVRVYHQDPELLDFDVERALNALISAYTAEQRGRTPPPPRLNERSQEVFDSVKAMAELRLGRDALVAEMGEELSLGASISEAELIACLKRIRKSVQRWTKEGGRQGYLVFVQQFIK